VLTCMMKVVCLYQIICLVDVTSAVMSQCEQLFSFMETLKTRLCHTAEHFGGACESQRQINPLKANGKCMYY
jgi:hypothetical protein